MPVSGVLALPCRGLRGLTGQTHVLHDEELGGGDFSLSDLSDCTVWLLGRLSALRMARLSRCRVYSGPVAGATFVEGKATSACAGQTILCTLRKA